VYKWGPIEENSTGSVSGGHQQKAGAKDAIRSTGMELLQMPLPTLDKNHGFEGLELSRRQLILGQSKGGSDIEKRE